MILQYGYSLYGDRINLSHVNQRRNDGLIRDVVSTWMRAIAGGQLTL